MKKTFLLVAVFLLLFMTTSPAQSKPSHLRISIITCTPGNELYSIFGHTALRITDSIQNTDLIYNYGTFDFDDPDFYTRFVRGKLNYFLSVEELPMFLYEYQQTNRAVTEQELLLSDSSKQAIQKAVTENLVGDNRFYKYDFLYDNCTSRVKNILTKYARMTVGKKLVSEETSFRDMIHEYLDRGGMAWTKLGMDILLGSPSDKAVSIDESMFLPDYLMKGIDSSVTITQPLLQEKRSILTSTIPANSSSTNWPFYFFTAIAAALLLISFSENHRAKFLTRLFDLLLFSITGLTGVFLLFAWFGTDHSSFAYNYNLLWALPTNIIAAAVLWRSPGWLSTYFRVCSIIYLLLLACFFWLPQQLNEAFIPLVILLVFRSQQLAKK